MAPIEEFELEMLADQILAPCRNKNSTLVLGALFSVIAPIIRTSPDKGHAYAAASFMEDLAKRLKDEIKV